MTPEAAQSLAEAGPWAVLIFFVGVVAIAVARVLIVAGREHLKADERDRGQRDQSEAHVVALEGLLENSLANNADAVAAWNKRNEQDAARARRADRP